VFAARFNGGFDAFAPDRGDALGVEEKLGAR